MDKIFKKYSNIVVINQKPGGIWRPKICMGDKTHRYYKYIKFHLNLRGDSKFLVDLTHIPSCWLDAVVGTTGSNTALCVFCPLIMLTS